jgi:hypothetical protein
VRCCASHAAISIDQRIGCCLYAAHCVNIALCSLHATTARTLFAATAVRTVVGRSHASRAAVLPLLRHRDGGTRNTTARFPPRLRAASFTRASYAHMHACTRHSSLLLSLSAVLASRAWRQSDRRNMVRWLLVWMDRGYRGM